MRIVVCVLACVATASFTGALAAHAPNHKRAGSVDVDIGVVAARQAAVAEPKMGTAAHREAGRRNNYHVVVSLRDVSSGQVVADAVIRAEVGALGMSTQTGSLDLMTINNTVSYGKYFVIRGQGPFTVHLWIERPGAVRSEVVFSLRRD